MIRIENHEVKFKHFPNGEKTFDGEKLLVEVLGFSKKEIQSSFIPDKTLEISIDLKYENDSSLIELMFIKRFLDPYVVRFNLFVMYMPYSRMDRSEINNPLTLKYVSEFINSLNFDSVTVVEPHSDVTCALLNNAKPYNISTKYLLKFLLQHIKNTSQFEFSKHYDYIVFPDAGAMKRYEKDFRDFKIAYGQKSRNFKTSKIESLEIVGFESKAVKNVIIIDDLISYGGTYVRTIKELREQGYDGNIYIVAAHCEDSVYKGELLSGEYSPKLIFTSSSIIDENNHLHKMNINNEKLKIINFGGTEQ